MIPTSGRKQADFNSEGDQPSAGNSSGDDHKITSSKSTEDHSLMLMLASNQDPCRACPLRPRGPMRYDAMLCDLPVNGKDLRRALRRAAEDTEDFQAEYRKQGGIEATYDMLKRVTGFGRLRIRGRPAVTMSTL
ncbi:MAG: transposase [Fuerstiella sp.]